MVYKVCFTTNMSIDRIGMLLKAMHFTMGPSGYVQNVVIEPVRGHKP